MHLTELVLHNVGPYRGRQRMDLATQEGRPVILIGGLNGCGKTTLLDAMQLALYGNRAQLSNRGNQAYDDYLASIVSRGVSLTEGASVSISFSVQAHGEQANYQVTRSWSAAGKRIRENLDVVLNGQWDKTLSSTWADHVEDLLPLEIAGLFFFDGEKIESLADPDRAASVIQTAIHSLLGASTIEQLRTDLSALQKRQVPESGDSALEQELRDLLEQHEQEAGELNATQERRAEIGVAREAALTDMQRAERDFAAEGGNIYERQARLESERVNLQAQLGSVHSQLRSLAEGILPLALVAASLKAVTKEVSEGLQAAEAQRLVSLLEERDTWLMHQLPPEVAPSVQDLLAADRRRRTPKRANQHGLAIGADEARSLELANTAISTQVKSAEALVKESEDLKESLAQSESLLGRIPDNSRVTHRMAARDAARARFSRLDGQLAILDEDLARKTRNLELLEVRIAKVEALRIQVGVDSEDKRRIVEHAERVRSTLATLSARLIERNIGRIEVATLDSFRRLMRKSGLVSDLRIDPNGYALQLTTASGNPLSPNRLSAGERQLLAVALLWGLARVAGNQLPTVIDTPLGRLDSVHRQHLVKRYFPQASDQVLLLSTDEEIDEGLLPELSHSIAASYLLEHDADQDLTVITPGYWWTTEDADVA